jgi:uncharacterized coiled-coil protein SlyX
VPEMADRGGHQHLREVVERFERADLALQQMTEGSGRTAQLSEVARWAEETLSILDELGEWMAEAWERVALVVEPLEDADPTADAPPDEDAPPPSWLEDLAADDLATDPSPDAHHAA